MKHIKKKFQFERLIPQDVLNSLSPQVLPLSGFALKGNKIPKGKEALLVFETNKVVKAFNVNLSGKCFFIPEPDPVLIYFNNSYVNYKDIQSVKSKVFKVLDTKLTEEIANHLYHYFGLTTGFVIFLFTAIEAFINRQIPDAYIYKKSTARNTEIYNKDQIQRYLSFDDKLKNILKETSSKDFAAHYPIKYQHIINLKEFRDSIVHTKANASGQTQFDYLYKKALSFKYEETMAATRDFMNYYEPNYIEDCDCGSDW